MENSDPTSSSQQEQTDVSMCFANNSECQMEKQLKIIRLDLKKKFPQFPESVGEILDYPLDPITGSLSKGMDIHGVIDLHVDDLFMTGGEIFDKEVLAKIKRDFPVRPISLLRFFFRFSL